jgi:hypothetical protein
MGQQNLISLERASLNIPSYSTSMDRTIDAMIGACSDAIVKWCRRDFTVKSYDELYNGTGDRRLLLRQYPLVSIESVRYRPVTVLKIINNSVSTYQQARATVTSTGLVLMTMASGVKALLTSGLDWVSCPTLASLAAAINALGNGWSAQAVGDSGQAGGQGDYGLWPSADLWVPQSYGTGVTSQGALMCRGAYAELKMHTYELQGYQWDPRGWLLRAIPYTDPELLHPEDLIWPVGINNFRIQYTAGYPTVPEAVQEACAEWVSALYNLAQRDPALLHQVPSSGTTSGWGPLFATRANMPANVQALLKPYRRFTMATDQG